MSYTSQSIRPMRYAVFLLLFAVFYLAGCGTPHQTYSYHGPNSLDMDQLAGSSFSVQWQAQPEKVVTDSPPVSLTLEAALIGPFQHIHDALGVIKKFKNDSTLAHMGPVVATAPPIHTNNWTNKPLTSIISFPSTLQS